MDVGLIEVFGFFLEAPDVYGQTALPQSSDTLSIHMGVGVAHGHNDATGSGGDDGRNTGRRSFAGMTARL